MRNLKSTYAIYKGKQSKIPFSPNAGKYGPGKTPYLDTFHAVIKREWCRIVDSKKNANIFAGFSQT